MDDYRLNIKFEDYDKSGEVFNVIKCEVLDCITMAIYENYSPRTLWGPYETMLDLTLRQILEKNFTIKPETASND
jgi:hypothetical protein